MAPAPSTLLFCSLSALSVLVQAQDASFTNDERFEEAILSTANRIRAEHGAPALIWNDTLADQALEWARQCKWRYSSNPSGETLAMGFNTANAAVESWASERDRYDFNNPGFSFKTNHFSQLVWKDSTSVGCARYQCGPDDTDDEHQGYENPDYDSATDDEFDREDDKYDDRYTDDGLTDDGRDDLTDGVPDDATDDGHDDGLTDDGLTDHDDNLTDNDHTDNDHDDALTDDGHDDDLTDDDLPNNVPDVPDVPDVPTDDDHDDALTGDDELTDTDHDDRRRRLNLKTRRRVRRVHRFKKPRRAANDDGYNTDDDNAHGWFVVCRYDPPGNIIAGNQFADNVAKHGTPVVDDDTVDDTAHDTGNDTANDTGYDTADDTGNDTDHGGNNNNNNNNSGGSPGSTPGEDSTDDPAEFTGAAVSKVVSLTGVLAGVMMVLGYVM